MVASARVFRRRVWCETLPYDELVRPDVLALLRRFDVAPILAVWPFTIAPALAAAARCEAEGLRPALWPMLADADGRWASAANMDAFVAFADRLAAVHDGGSPRERGSPPIPPGPREIVVDLEPAIESMRASIATRGLSVHALPIAFDRADDDRAEAALAALAGRLRARGIAVSAAVAPTVLLDRGAGGAWQELLGTPALGLPWDHVSAMLYTSIIEGWSRGLIGRGDARALLDAGAEAAIERFGERAGASLGAVGTGAFGDEPVYRSAAELADDVSIARAAGLDDLALFDLGGVLRRPPAEAWLEAFVATAPARERPPRTLRARALLAGARAAGGALGAFGRLRDAVAPRRRSPK